MNDSVFLTGGSGLLAINWALTMRNKRSVILGLHEREISLRNVTSCKVDLESIDQIVQTFKIFKPTLVVHTAGLTNVEICESNPEIARHVNVVLAVNVATAAAELGIPMVHISTDHLFRGNMKMLNENQPVKPINNYGYTKAEAEIRVLETFDRALIIRTNFYGWGPVYRRSFSDMIIESLRGGKKITLFDDVFYTPIHVQALTEIVHELVDKNAFGVFNVVGDDRISKFQFGKKLAARFKVDDSLIIPGLISKQKSLIIRPLEMSLSNRKASDFLKKSIGGIDIHLGILEEQERAGIAKEINNI